MRKFTFILIMLFVGAINAKSQIPNNGFEDWNTTGSYLEPQGYLTPNSYATTSFYPITRSSDHYPVAIGNYSIRIENKPSLLPNGDALGLVLQNTHNTLLSGPGPSFPIIGHPTSLTGYYKYAPLNGDTMLIQIQLFQNGFEVSYGVFSTITSASNWTSFNIPLPSYTSADSGSILLASYNAEGPPPDYFPHGNSVLYIDNLNFDNLIGSVPEQSSKNISFNLYPNPATDVVNLNIDNIDNAELTLTIYNVIGKLIRSEIVPQNQRQINVSDLNSGIYLVTLESKGLIKNQSLIIQR
jgi:hypothetical protein